MELTFDDLGEFDASVVRQWDECVSLMLDLEKDEKYSLQEELEAFHRDRPRRGLARRSGPVKPVIFDFLWLTLILEQLYEILPRHPAIDIEACHLIHEGGPCRESGRR